MIKKNVDWGGVIRTLLSAAGAFLLGRNILGHTIDESWWQEAVGVLMGIVSIVWSIRDKTATIEAIQGAARQAISFIGGLLVGAGYMTAQTLTAVLGFIIAVGPFIQGWLERLKNRKIENGDIPLHALKK